MKTPLKQALEKIDSAIEMWKNPSNEMDGLHTLETLKSEISELIEPEKQAIKDAFNQGFREGERWDQPDISDFNDAENYYNDTFKTDNS